MHPTTANKSPGRSSLSESTALKAVFSKVDWRLIPLLLIAYMVAYLDRINIGYAQLQMKQTLPFDDAVYGLGAGIFFIGYFVFEVPSNLLLEKIGAHRSTFIARRLSTTSRRRRDGVVWQVEPLRARRGGEGKATKAMV